MNHKTIMRLSVRCYAVPKVPRAKWYYNTDSPLWKPDWYEYAVSDQPKKFVPFSDHDQVRLEKAYAARQSSTSVKEDRLFRVNLDSMLLAPIYWPGPTYEVRRGTWFTRDGVPLAGVVGQELERGYWALRADRFGGETEGETEGGVFKEESTARESRARESVESGPGGTGTHVNARDLVDRFHQRSTTPQTPVDIARERDVVALSDGRAAIFFDATSAVIFPASLSAFQVGILRSLKPTYATLMSVTPVRRGYTAGLDDSVVDSVRSVNVSSLPQVFLAELAALFSKDGESHTEDHTDADKSRILGRVMEADLLEQPKVVPRRQIRHLVLCVHGVGQLLGGRYESVNFTHSINVLRASMRDLYASDAMYHRLAHREGYDASDADQRANNTIQMLPISWRHQVLFHPRRPVKGTKQVYPTLEQLNTDGVRALRNIIGDVALDILLFYEPAHLKQILKAVLTKLNRVYRLYRENNPEFSGKVHLFGHSLGSAICFDLLAQQNDPDSEYRLDFDVHNFFCVGLPVGMFKLLQQKTIAPHDGGDSGGIGLDKDCITPRCKNLYNVFHPCDPFGYRLEPLVDMQFARVKPEEVPFAVLGLNTQVQNLTSLGDDIQDRLRLASSWFSAEKASDKDVAPAKSVEDENALGDIISSLTARKAQKSANKSKETEMYHKQQLENLLRMNRTGRIDYSLPKSMFSIAIVSAISAHISYFEDQETAGFVMREILCSDDPPVESRKVIVEG